MSVPPSFNFYSEIILVLRLLEVSNWTKIIFLVIFFFSGVYSIMFYVLANHGEAKKKETRTTSLFGVEIIVAIFHLIPLTLRILFLKIF